MLFQTISYFFYTKFFFKVIQFLIYKYIEINKIVFPPKYIEEISLQCIAKTTQHTVIHRNSVTPQSTPRNMGVILTMSVKISLKFWKKIFLF